jgi:hypothetical protein
VALLFGIINKRKEQELCRVPRIQIGYMTPDNTIQERRGDKMRGREGGRLKPQQLHCKRKNGCKKVNGGWIIEQGKCEGKNEGEVVREDERVRVNDRERERVQVKGGSDGNIAIGWTVDEQQNITFD